MKDEYSDIKKVKPEGNSFVIGDIYIGYMPYGFKYEVIQDTSNFKLIDFFKDNEYFRLKITESNWGDQINTETQVIEEIVINNCDMVYYENEEEKSLSWKNSKVYTISTNSEKDILLEIARNIKIDENISPEKH